MPLRWTCPTARETHVFSEKTDVWSFGILMIEIYTNGEKPYPNMINEKVIKSLLDGFRIPQPFGCSLNIYNIILSCWNKLDERPTFEQIKNKLNNIKNDNNLETRFVEEEVNNSEINMTLTSKLNDTYAKEIGEQATYPNESNYEYVKLPFND